MRTFWLLEKTLLEGPQLHEAGKTVLVVVIEDSVAPASKTTAGATPLNVTSVQVTSDVGI